MRTVRSSFAAVLFCLSILSVVARAQITGVTNSTSTPIPGAGHDYIHLLSETVDPANGSVSLRLGVPTPPGRQLTLPFAFSYDSNGVHFPIDHGEGERTPYWRSNTGVLSKGGWGYPIPTFTETSGWETATTPPNSTCRYYKTYLFQDPSGGRHALGLADITTPSYYQCPAVGQSILTGGDDLYRAVATPLTVVDANGTVYFGDLGGHTVGEVTTNSHTYMRLAYSIEDRNGNSIVLGDADPTGTSGAFSAIDTLGRTLLSASGFGTTGNTLTVAGLSSPYTLTWGTAPSNFTVSYSPTTLQCVINSDNETQSVVTAITLPNGQQYQFSYDPTYGELSKVIYPSGGYVSYAWGLNLQSADITLQVNQPGWKGQCAMIYDKPAVLHRYVSYDGQTIALQQDFTYATNYSCTPSISCQGPPWVTKQTTVATYDRIRGISFQTSYTYTPGPGVGQPYDLSLGDHSIPVERTVLHKDFNGSVLRTVTKGWLDQYELGCELETLDNGLISGTFYTYGPGAQVTDKKEYDYGLISSTSACPTYPNAINPPSGITPTRETVTNYQAFANTPTYPSGPSIFDHPSSVINYGSGTRVAETDYAYDQSTASTVSPAPTGHDETNYSASYNGRGNATTVTKQCFVGSAACTNSVTTYTHDETGQVLSMTDPCGNASCSDLSGTNHTTTLSYADNFDSNTSSNTNAYLTQITNPLGQVSKFKYAYSDGQLIQSQDQNDINASRQGTTYLYADSLRRLKETDYPDGGQTLNSYSDAPPNPTVTSSRKLDTSGRYVASATTMDGLGHVIKTLLTPDPECASGDRTDISYDGLGRTYTVSNPYCTTGDATYGLTTYAYDALGRTTSVTEPDGSVVSTVYSGNTVTVTDEAGKKRQSTSDGLGRLTQVTEDPGGLGYLTTYAYDALDNLLNVVQNGSRPRTFAYDSLSRLTAANNPESGIVYYSYDANGNLNQKAAPAPNQTGTTYVYTNFGYDALNRVIWKVYNNGNPSVQYSYDQTAPWGVTLTNPIGRLTAISTFDGTCYPTASTFGYDAMGRVNFQEDYLNTAETSGCPGHWTPIYASYDLAGNQTSLTYPSGRVIKSQFSGASRLTNVKVDDLNGYPYLSSATYAPNGAPATVALGNGLTETSTYNKRFQPNDLKIAGSSTLLDHIYNFNPGHDNGNVLSVADNLISGRTQSFTYDSLNRLSTAQTSATSGPDCWGGQFGYDAWGNLLTGTPTNCGFYNGNFGVNANNQITNTGFGYDVAGNMTADGTNTYAYDAESHITSLNSGSSTYTYDAEGRRMAKKIGSATTEYIYFNGDVLSEYSLGDQVWNDYIFAGGRRLAAAGTDDILNPGFEQGMEGWGTGASDSSGSAQLITDSTRAHSGNDYIQLSTTTAQVVADNEVVAVNPGDQLTFGGWAYLESGSASGGWVSWNLAVRDANGNVLGYPSTGNIASATWTLLSQNYTVPASGASVVLYAQILQPTGATTARFDDGFLTGASGQGVHYYHGDHLGSARLMTDSGGNVTWSATYLPFGQEWNPQATTNHYKFTTKERDSESGLDNFGARYNSSSLGRFMSPDPAGMMAVDIGSPQTLNRYSYVLNNPLAFTDPFGLDCAYLNSSGTGLDKHGIDQNSSSGECGKTGGYWVEGTITQVNIDSNATTISLTGTTNGTNQTSASYQQDAVVTVGEYNNTSANPYNHIALGLFGQPQFGQNPRSDARFLYALSVHGPTATVPGAIKQQRGGRLLRMVRIRATGMQSQMLQNAMTQSAQNPPPYTLFGTTGCDCGTWAQMMLGDAGISAGPPAPLPDVLMDQLNQLYPQQQQPQPPQQ